MGFSEDHMHQVISSLRGRPSLENQLKRIHEQVEQRGWALVEVNSAIELENVDMLVSIGVIDVLDREMALSHSASASIVAGEVICGLTPLGMALANSVAVDGA